MQMQFTLHLLCMIVLSQTDQNVPVIDVCFMLLLETSHVAVQVGCFHKQWSREPAVFRVMSCSGTSHEAAGVTKLINACRARDVSWNASASQQSKTAQSTGLDYSLQESTLSSPLGGWLSLCSLTVLLPTTCRHRHRSKQVPSPAAHDMHAKTIKRTASACYFWQSISFEMYMVMPVYKRHKLPA